MADPESFEVVRSRQMDEDEVWAKSKLAKAEDWVSNEADRERALLNPNDTRGLLAHDVAIGITKTAYHLAKGLLGLAWDVGRLGNDPVAREAFGKKVWSGAVWLAKEAYISQGHAGPEAVQDQNERIIAFSKGLWNKVKKSWEEAGNKPGHQTQLVVEAAATIALFFVGGEAAAAGDAEKLAETGRILDGAEVGCKTIIMSNKEILAEQALKEVAAAKEAANAAKAAKAAQDVKEAVAAAEAAEAAKAAEAAGAAKLARQRLVDRAGPPQDPWLVRKGEGVLPKTAKTAAPGKPMVLDPKVSDRYMYVVKENGDVVYAPQKMKGNLETVKHTDLAENGPARVSGELNYDQSTGKWVMDAESGRYSAAPAFPGNPNSPIISTRTPENLEAAAELARQSGTSAEIVVAK